MTELRSEHEIITDAKPILLEILETSKNSPRLAELFFEFLCLSMEWQYHKHKLEVAK